MQAVILAAGKGARLQHLTQLRSKGMLPILGKPMVARVIDSIAANGINDFIIVASPDDQEIQAYFHPPAHPDARFQFVFQPQRLGMGDALRCAAPLIRQDFLLSACDSLVPAQQIAPMIDAWYGTDAPNAILALMPVPVEKISSTGIVALQDGWVTQIVEKPSLEEAPSHISSLPLYLFKETFIQYLANLSLSRRGEYELQEAIQECINHTGRVRGIMVSERLTVTRPGDLLAINLHFLAQQAPPVFDPGGAEQHSTILPPVMIGPQVSIGEHSQIGPNVYIEGCCQVGSGVHIEEAVVLRGVNIPDHTHIHHQLVS